MAQVQQKAADKAPRRMRRKRIPTTPEMEAEMRRMIDQHIATVGVTKCPTMYALGSVKLTQLGVDT